MIVRIAPMEFSDIQAVMALDLAVYPTVWSRATWRHELEQMPNGRVYVTARSDRDHVGHAGLIAQVDEGHIATVAVSPDEQGKGIGAALMLTLAREAIACRLDALTLEVRSSNEAAQALYSRFGFVPVGHRKGYYGGDEDALVMWAHDIGRPHYRQRLERIDASLDSRFLFDANLETAKASI